MPNRNVQWFGIVGVALLLACFVGCGGPRSHTDFMPAEDRARQALDAALAAWQKGERVGKIDDGPPVIQIVDSKWKAGQKLQSYQIIEALPGNGPKHFVVRLTLKQPRSELEARYVVLGKDPLWVYREEDYKKLSGM